MIEVEQRGLLTEKEYAILRAKLQSAAIFLGNDNKYVEYWIYSDKLLKLIQNNSKKNSVLSLKLGTIGNSNSREEYEIKLGLEDFSKLEKIISNITAPDQIIKGTQKRENYKLDDVEIAIKWSEDWKYHFELECLIMNDSQREVASKKIQKIAELLKIKTMSPEEEKEFINKIRASKK